MRLLTVVRKELRRRRVACLVSFCLANLLVLLAAVMLPRSYSAFIELRFDDAAGEASAAMARAQALFQRQAAAQQHSVLLHNSGSNLRVALAAASGSQAFEALDGMLNSLGQSEFQRLRGMREEQLRAAESELEKSAASLREREAKLNDSLRISPEGGESGVGARIGQLLGQLDALTLQLRGDEESIARLRVRLQDIDARIAGLDPAAAVADPATTERVQLENEKRVLALDLRQAGDDMAIKRKRAAELRVLLEQSRVQAVELQKDNQLVAGLRRDYDTAVLLNRQLSARLQQLQLDAASPQSAQQLPYEVVQPPRVPRTADGAPVWLYSLAAMCAGVLVAVLPLLSSVLVDNRVRLPDPLVAAAEVPVLAVIPEYEPLRSVADVRWRVISALLLLAVVVAAHAAFLVTEYGAA